MIEVRILIFRISALESFFKDLIVFSKPTYDRKLRGSKLLTRMLVIKTALPLSQRKTSRCEFRLAFDQMPLHYVIFASNMTHFVEAFNIGKKCRWTKKARDDGSHLVQLVIQKIGSEETGIGVKIWLFNRRWTLNCNVMSLKLTAKWILNSIYYRAFKSTTLRTSIRIFFCCCRLLISRNRNWKIYTVNNARKYRLRDTVATDQISNGTVQNRTEETWTAGARNI